MSELENSILAALADGHEVVLLADARGRVTAWLSIAAHPEFQERVPGDLARPDELGAALAGACERLKKRHAYYQKHGQAGRIRAESNHAVPQEKPRHESGLDDAPKPEKQCGPQADERPRGIEYVRQKAESAKAGKTRQGGLL